MQYELTPHQVQDSAAMLEYQHSLLWADAGTGKTVTAMAALQQGGYDKVMVVCPKLAVPMWVEELEANMGTSKLDTQLGRPYWAKYKTTSRFGKGEALGNADALVATFGIVRSWLTSEDFNVRRIPRIFVNGGKQGSPCWRDPKGDNRYRTALIIDEAHNLKSRTAKQAMAVFGPRFVPTPRALYSMFDDTWQLTGTPVTRYFDDLWTQLRAVRPEILKHYKVYEYVDFRNKFCKLKSIYRGTRQEVVVCGNQNHALMERLLADCYVIRRKLADVVDNLPSITHRSVGVSVSGVPSIGKMSAEDASKALNNPDSELSAVRRLMGVAKVKDTLEYIYEYAQKPCLIGYWHKDVGAELKLGLMDAVIVDGSTPTKERERIKDAFNAGEIPYLLGQMQAMSTSWNIQEACSHVIIAEELPSPAMLHQFYSRVYRRGQKRHVQVDHMRSEHRLDEVLREIRERKDADNKRVNL